jgi:hypothetical protein
MDKILGEVFDEYVDTQIKVRQKSLGKSQKSTDDLLVFNSSTPWIRLSSSVIVDEDRAKTLATNLGINQSEIVGNNLAKNLVLFAGTSDGANLSNRKGGVGYGLESSYGFLSDGEQGYKPMPGVTGITANYKNNGTLKQAQVKLTCFTRKQFEAIEAIYLRLGFTMILEWGHSVYFNNEGVKENMSSLKIPNMLFVEKLPPLKLLEDLSSTNTGVEGVKLFEEQTEDKQKATALKYGLTPKEFKKIISTSYSPERVRIAINDNKEKTGGNYDAMMAKVSNFSWTLNSDLSYSITLDLVSVGDIIDSLKMNFGGTQVTRTDTSQLVLDRAVQNLATIELNSGASAFNSFLNELTQLLQTKEAVSSLDEVSQEQLRLKDEAISILTELVPKIQDTYPPVLEELRKKYITSYKNIQTFLNGKEVIVTRSRYGGQASLSQALKTELLQQLKDNGFEVLYSGSQAVRSNYQEFPIENFDYPIFDLIVTDISLPRNAPSGKGTLRIDIETDTSNDGPLTKGVKELEKQLNTVREQVNRVIVNAQKSNPEDINLPLLRYLGEQSDRAKEVILNGLLTGFYDAPENNIKSNIELSDYWLSTTLIRKWIEKTRLNPI